jgi:hypothetical protein
MPPRVLDDFGHVSATTAIIVVLIFVVLGALAVVFRLVARTLLVSSFGFDEGVMMIAIVSAHCLVYCFRLRSQLTVRQIIDIVQSAFEVLARTSTLHLPVRTNERR